MRKVIGTAAVQSPVTGKWTLVVADRDSDHVLFAVDPQTGNTLHLMDTQDDYEGLTSTPGGMLLATVGGLIITPYLYYMVARMTEKKGGEQPPAEPPPDTPDPSGPVNTEPIPTGVES